MSKALNNIDLTAAERKEVAALLQRYLPDTEVWAYGSRVKFTAKPHSDLDMVAFASKEQSQAVANLREAFEESYLPFRVDLFVWDEVPEGFYGNIEEVRVVVQEKKHSKNQPNNWKILTLSKIINLIGGGTPKRSKQAYWNGNIPWLSVKDFNNQYRYVDSAEETITELGEQESSTRVLKTGQLIISARGTVGALAQLTQPMAFNQSCYGIDAKREYTDNDFLYYLIKHSIDNLKQITHGAVFDTITRETFNHIEVSLPPPPQQKAIAHILGSLDDKIELNRRMNETLEAMAQALFKSWFVDFDPVIDNALAAGNAIPDELKEKSEIRQRLGDEQKSLPDDIRRLFPSEFAYTEEMGWVPKEWEVSKVGQEVEITGGGTPNKKDESFWSEGANAFCTPKDMSISPSTILLKTQFQLTDKGVSKVSSGQLSPGAVLISSRAPIGYLVITNIPVTINQGIIAMLKQAQFSELFLFCWAKCNMNEMLLRANGSTFLEINKKNFRNIPFLVPSKDILTAFNNLTNEFIMRITSCSKEIQSLRFFRDNLFSKLLAGEIRIQKTDKILEKLK